MNRVAMSLKALTHTGQARLIILIATAWIVSWGSVWGYSTYRTNSMDRWISAELDVSEKLVVELAELEKIGPDPAKESRVHLVLDNIEIEMARRDATDRWADRAKWTGPIGLAAILFSGIGGLWVYRGFRKPVATNR